MLIRRLVLLLTVTLFGAGAAGQGSRLVTGDAASCEADPAAALVVPDHDPSDAVIRSSGRLLSLGLQIGSGMGAAPRGGRPEPTDAPTMAFVTIGPITAVVARIVKTAHRAYAGALARAHSGFVSSPSTAPPPFRFV